MHIDPRLLTLTQWLSPGYPLGSFAWSHGLEAAVNAGWVTDAAGLEAWLMDLLTDGSGRSDAVLIRLAHTADEAQLPELDATARAYAPGRERLRETERLGKAFTLTTAEVWNLDLPDLVFPVALGHAARKLDLDIDVLVTVYLQSFVANLVQAAQRLMPLGQTGGQKVLANLNPKCVDVADATRSATVDDLYSNAFLSDVAAMNHETQEPRLFQS